MLTFLRRIRKGFFGSGQASRYLMYAIGEIALVVLGILIALQINNWNEERKLRNELSRSLVAIQKETEQDILFYDELIEDATSRLSFLLALSNKEYDKINLRSTSQLIAKDLYPRQFGTSYYAIKENGMLNDIKNEALKNRMITYFEELSTEFNKYSSWHHKFVADNIDTYILNHLPLDQNVFTEDSAVRKEMENTRLPNIVNFQMMCFREFKTLATNNSAAAQNLIEDIGKETRKRG